eukprot:TRINITY_DN2266_c0_g1_i1.p1 TRINITY_DN2266_c0_g1~~TRINITY_DN2266_c0_g1_i1.p1  ORF type:complete len:267 (+),score=76.93 TRINITY_DN2266_c0_g1_i1:67-867(+)
MTSVDSGALSRLLWMSDSLLTRWEQRRHGGHDERDGRRGDMHLLDALPWARWMEATQPAPMVRPKHRFMSAVRLEQLSSFDLTDIEMEQWEKCNICCEPFTEADRTCYALDCYHVFHTRCAEAWWRRDASCPLCRSRVIKTTRQGLQLREQKIKQWTNEKDQRRRAHRRRMRTLTRSAASAHEPPCEAAAAPARPPPAPTTVGKVPKSVKGGGKPARGVRLRSHTASTESTAGSGSTEDAGAAGKRRRVAAGRSLKRPRVSRREAS